MQKNVGSLLALYPTPVTIVGAKTKERVNWLLAAHVGIIGHDRILISLAKNHYTNQGIKDTGKVSVALVNEKMIPKADYVGSVSGAKEDKSEVFVWHEGENGAPVIDESPLVLECEVTDNYETDTFDNFILKINATYVEESKLNEHGKPDYEKIAPVLFEFPTYSYLSCGKVIGKCLSFK
ncbi:flavin reductase family protein [Blautia schinkii]|nr:flavin reductase family protein [Blautia schinkii]